MPSKKGPAMGHLPSNTKSVVGIGVGRLVEVRSKFVCTVALCAKETPLVFSSKISISPLYSQENLT